MKRIFFTISFILNLAVASAYAQTSGSANFEQTTQVLDAGGRDAQTTSENFELIQSSFGQTVIGSSASTNFSLSGGYLATPSMSAKPGEITMDIRGLIKDLTDTEVQVEDITAVVVSPNTKIFISADGQDGTQDFVDSTSRHTITAVGDAQIDTAESHSGGASVYFDGSGDYLTIPDSDDWSFGTGDFTIDFWVKWNDKSGTQVFFRQFQSNGNEWVFDKTSTDFLNIYFNNDGVTIGQCVTKNAVNFSNNVWYHLEFTRNGSNAYIFVDGVSQTLDLTTPSFGTKDVGNISAQLRIGADELGTSVVNGWIDELTITKIDQEVVEGEEFIASDMSFTEGPATIHITAKDQFDQTTELDVNFTLDVTPPGRPTLDPVETPTESPIQVISGTKEANTSIWLIKDAKETETVIDPNLRLYIPADGEDGSKNFTDAGKGHTITAVGDAQIDTEQSQSGGASALFDGNGDYLSIPDSEDWNFGTNDFTIDFWMKLNSLPVAGNRFTFVSQSFHDDNAWNVWRFALRNDGGSYSLDFHEYISQYTINFQYPWSPSTQTWYHLTLARDGDNWNIYVDGTALGTTYIKSLTLTNISGQLLIGAQEEGFFNVDGWIDELTISVFDEEAVPSNEQTTWQYPLDLNEGENNFEIYAKDEAGNESTRVGGEIYLDLENPNVQIIYPANGAKVNKTTVSVLGTVDDDQTRVTIDANGYSYPVIVQNRMFSVDNVVLLDNTWNAVTAVANSPGGKEFVDPVSIRCETSATLPSTPTLNLVTSPTNQNSQTISGTKPANTYLWLNGVKRTDVSSSSTSWSFNLPLSSGGNPILLYVKDSDSTSAKVSGAVSASIFYDTTAPTRPQVIDDGVSTDKTSSLHAKWAASDSETDIGDYRVAIGTTKGDQDLMAFTSVGAETEVTQGGLTLGQGQTYYFTVIAKNAAGSESEPGYSDGIRVNGSVPKITNITLADKSKIYQGTNGINISVSAEDKDNDTLEYRFTINGSIVKNWSTSSSYTWNVPADLFGNIHVVLEARDPIGGSAYEDVSVFVLKQPIAAP